MNRILIVIFFVSIFNHLFAQDQALVAPSNKPADVLIDGNILKIVYDGKVLLKATVTNDPSEFYVKKLVDYQDDRLTQVISLTTNSNEYITLNGIVTGSEESFPCEVDPKISGTVVVRHTVGLSSNLLNRAVYDRKSDWVLSLDKSFATSKVKINPINSSSSENQFGVEIKSKEIIFRFRPHYYQYHRGLKYFEPWTYKTWDKSVVGWCSWFAYFGQVSETDIKETVDVIAEKVKPYGLDYLQIDDGFQQMTAEPDKWLNPNKKFPGGMDGLADYISDKGLIPGIWTNVAFNNSKYANKHKNFFVTEETGELTEARLLRYIIDGSNPQALDELIRPIYKGFSEMGWKYFKLDALRHLKYEGYNSNPAYFERKGTERVQAFRNIVQTVRDEIGRDNFLLGCWGTRPELTGLIDGCRIGGDGYGFETLAQYNSFNNVVWRNDPDHIELDENEAYRSCTVTSLTGSLFMLTDKPEVYQTSIIEPARRSIPVLFTLPGQIFDVDPARSSNLWRVDSELSGSGERTVDGSRTTPYDLFALEINRPFENWMILGRTGNNTSFIEFSDLGLPADEEYLVYEFWSKKYIGSFTQGLKMSDIDPKYNCQVFCIRQRKNNPQLLATNRHISCGGLEISNLIWENDILTATSEVVANDTYTIYVTEPGDKRFEKFECAGVKMVANKKKGFLREISVIADESKSIDWKIFYDM